MVHLNVYDRSTFSDTKLPEVDPAKLPFPWVDSPFFETLIKPKNLSPLEERQIRDYRQNGFLIVEGDTIEKSLTDRINDDMEGRMDKSSGRLQDGWRRSQSVRELAVHEKILSVLRLLYEREPLPFQTLNFVKGTEQGTHSDAIHFNSLPHGFMAAAWVALEDITIKQGPLHYFPGSHKLKDFDYYDLGIASELLFPEEQDLHNEINFRSNPVQLKYRLYEISIAKLAEEYGFERRELTLKRGDFLIWSGNLLHGGNPILEPGSTRKSQVIHYHFDGVIPFTPHFSNARLGIYHVPPLVNIRTNEPMSFSYNFMPVNFIPQEVKNRYRIDLNPKGEESAGAKNGARPYYEELEEMRGKMEGYEKEVERLQKEIQAITSTRIWKTFQPLRELKQKLLG